MKDFSLDVKEESKRANSDKHNIVVPSISRFSATEVIELTLTTWSISVYIYIHAMPYIVA
jgi:hypothetical protein